MSDLSKLVAKLKFFFASSYFHTGLWVLLLQNTSGMCHLINLNSARKSKIAL